MFWLAFEARQGAERKGTPRDDVEGVGEATGSGRVFFYDYGRYPYRLRRARGVGRSNLKNGKKQLCAKLPDGRSIAEPVRAGIATLTYI